MSKRRINETRLYIDNIPIRTNWADLAWILSRFGEIKSLVRYRDSDEAYVEYEHLQSSYVAREKLSGYQLGKRRLFIDWAD